MRKAASEGTLGPWTFGIQLYNCSIGVDFVNDIYLIKINKTVKGLTLTFAGCISCEKTYY